ncbi:MAG: serine/threonine-protein kinase [Pseudomonadota bacterium]
MSSMAESQKLGRYIILSVLGKGGMGTVYKATDPVLGRDVALKVGKPAEIGLPERDHMVYEQCLREARLAARFIHPNIVITYDAGFEKELFFIALEYIDGKGLQYYSRPSALLPPIQVMEILYNVCYALEYIHNMGYVHLDVKPENIMLTQTGDVKLMDFGISRLLQDHPEDNLRTSGSLYYMSPEQTDPSGSLDRQSDIFSLGVVAYHLLTGKRPFHGEDPLQIFYQIIHHDPEPIRSIVPGISEDLQAVIGKAMRKDRKDRFQTAKEFADAILPLIKGSDSKALSTQQKKKISYVKRLLLFRHFQDSDIEEVLHISSWSFHPERTWIIEESKNDRNIYILVLGRASIHINQEVKPLKPGDCFGESAVLHSMPRKAKLWAEKDCVVMSINASLLNQASPEVQVKFLREFYMNKTVQLVEANLRLIQKGLPH